MKQGPSLERREGKEGRKGNSWKGDTPTQQTISFFSIFSKLPTFSYGLNCWKVSNDNNMRIATLATAGAWKDLETLLWTIRQWHGDAEVFVAADTEIASKLVGQSSVHVRTLLDDYKGLSRKDMEAMSGRTYPTRWHDFMMEKATVLAWALELASKEGGKGGEEEGVWFLDADVCLLAPLVQPKAGLDLCLSPHMIRPVDETRYGRFNGGFLWIRDPGLLSVWKRATFGSRFYEQAALEHVWDSVADSKRAELPIQDNFGWWRFLQSTEAPPIIQSRLGFNRIAPGVGLQYDGASLRSIHTHWEEASEFNQWIRGKLEFLARSHAPAKALLGHLGRLHGWKKTQTK